MHVCVLVEKMATDFISLHTHSVRETICDARANLGEKILCSKSQEYPILGKNAPPPLPELELLMEDLRSSGLKLVNNIPSPNQIWVRT